MQLEREEPRRETKRKITGKEGERNACGKNQRRSEGCSTESLFGNSLLRSEEIEDVQLESYDSTFELGK